MFVLFSTYRKMCLKKYLTHYNCFVRMKIISHFSFQIRSKINIDHRKNLSFFVRMKIIPIISHSKYEAKSILIIAKISVFSFEWKSSQSFLIPNTEQNQYWSSQKSQFFHIHSPGASVLHSSNPRIDNCRWSPLIQSSSFTVELKRADALDRSFCETFPADR